MLWIDELSRLSPTFDFGASVDRSGSPSLSSRQGHATIRSPEPLRGSLCVRKRTLRLPLEIRSVSYLGLRCKLALVACKAQNAPEAVAIGVVAMASVTVSQYRSVIPAADLFVEPLQFGSPPAFAMATRDLPTGRNLCGRSPLSSFIAQAPYGAHAGLALDCHQVIEYGAGGQARIAD